MPLRQPPRIAPLPEAEWDARLGPIRQRLEPVLNVHRVLANHPDLLAAWAPLREHITMQGSLLPRHREIVILRLAHRAQSEYEWQHHAVRGREAGLSESEIGAIRSGAGAAWTDAEAVLLAATDELFDGLAIGDQTWGGLEAAFITEQILDLVVTVGVYSTLAMLIASAGVQMEEMPTS